MPELGPINDSEKTESIGVKVKEWVSKQAETVREVWKIDPKDAAIFSLAFAAYGVFSTAIGQALGEPGLGLEITGVPVMVAGGIGLGISTVRFAGEAIREFVISVKSEQNKK